MKIVYLDTFALGDVNLDVIAALGDLTAYDDTPQHLAVERSADAEVVITNKVKFFKDEIDALPYLRLICVSATGTNNIDIEYANSKGVEVKNVSGYSTESVAEATFGMALALLRNIVTYDTYVKNGDYSASGQWFTLLRPISEIAGKRWGIIGMGNIGRRVATIAEAFGAEVAYYSTSGANRDAGYRCMKLDDLLAWADIVSIHAPLNPATKWLIGYERLKLMRPTAIMINVGRGKIVNETDLARALNEGVIAGAGFDVFAREPIDNDNALLRLNDMSKVVLTPHTAWASEEARRTLVEGVAQNIIAFINTHRAK